MGGQAPERDLVGFLVASSNRLPRFRLGTQRSDFLVNHERQTTRPTISLHPHHFIFKILALPDKLLGFPILVGEPET